MQAPSQLPPLTNAQLITSTFGTIAIGYGLRAVLAPSSFAHAFGLPSPSSLSARGKTDPSNEIGATIAFIATTGGRTTDLGCAILTLGLRNQIYASGVVVASCAVSGLVDTFTTYRYCSTAAARRGGEQNGGVDGSGYAYVQHAIGTIVLGGLGWYLMSVPS